MKHRTNWRDYYNPIRGLTMSRLMGMEADADRGQFADLQWFFMHMERADVTIAAAMARRLAFIDSLDWEIRVAENADPYLGGEQADLLRYAYDRISNFKQASYFLASALFRGFAHVQKIRAGYGTLVSKLDPVEQWYWVRNERGDWRLNPETKQNEPKGEVVDPREFCVMEAPALHRGIDRHFFSKQLAMADWDAALDASANQSIFFVGPPGTTPEKEAEYLAMAEQLASNRRGYLPPGADVKTIDLAQRSRVPYQERIDYCDRQIVLAATGGLLTMLTESGSGTLAGGAHSEGLLELAKSDAAKLSEVYQRDLDAEWLDTFFPHHPHAAYFAFNIPQQENVPQLLENVANLNWAGYRVDKALLEEKTGLKLIDAVPPGA